MLNWGVGVLGSKPSSAPRNVRLMKTLGDKKFVQKIRNLEKKKAPFFFSDAIDVNNEGEHLSVIRQNVSVNTKF